MERVFDTMTIRARRLMTTAATMFAMFSPVEAAAYPRFRDFPDRTFVCERTERSPDTTPANAHIKVETSTRTMYVNRSDGSHDAYRISNFVALPNPNVTDKFGVRVNEVAWDMARILIDLPNAQLATDSGYIWAFTDHIRRSQGSIQEDGDFYHCIPSEPTWRIFNSN
jgi:hypothetical protein